MHKRVEEKLDSKSKTSNQRKYESNPFKLVRFFDHRTSKIRFLIVNRHTQIPVKAVSVIEIYLQHKSDSPNSIQAILSKVLYLYWWGLHTSHDLDSMLLSGEALDQTQIRAFRSWLKEKMVSPQNILSHSQRKTFNHIIACCSQVCNWSVSQFSVLHSSGPYRALELNALKEIHRSMWKAEKLKVRDSNAAPDLTDEEIEVIEKFLKPANRSKSVGIDRAVRDYLIWRLVIEFGMRIGEVLALRKQDCPTRNAPYFSIVRIEERGHNYADPRINPPRPKTLSRDLGVLLENSAFPLLASEYIANHRYVWNEVRGRKIKKFLLSHDFLVIARNGSPLSTRAADDIAQAIKRGTCIDFHWHLARHAFFNRSYMAVTKVADKEERAAKMQDLVVWGGWTDEKSLRIYTQRAREQRARRALPFWRQGDVHWNALD